MQHPPVQPLSGWTTVDSGLRTFKEAPLTLSSDLGDPGSPDRAPLLLVSAPGAVGKTTLAKQIAFHTGSIYLDLGAAGPVGDHTLSGGLFRSGLTQHWLDDNIAILIDGLDEARLRVTQEAFEAFLCDVAQLSKGRQLATVLFGRTRAIEDAWLVLDDQGVESAVLEIGYFEPQAATEFSTELVSESCSTDRHLHVRLEAVRLLLSRLRQQTEQDGDRFTGYAPVLVAVADRVTKARNPGALVAGIKSGSMSVTLQSVIDAILDREHSKLQSLTFDDSALTSALYQPAEQMDRLVVKRYGTPKPLAVAAMSSDDEEVYERALATWVPEHPFLGGSGDSPSVVFDAAITAHALGSSRASEAALRREFGRDANPFLSLFYPSGTGPSPSESLPLGLPAEHIGVVYASVRARLTLSETGNLLVTERDEVEPGSALPHLDVEISITKNDQERHERLIKFVSEQSAPIRIGPHLADAEIEVPKGRIEIGNGTRVRLVAPVTIECREMKLSAEEFIVEASRRESYASAVVLYAEEVDASIADIPKLRGNVEFCVSWPGAHAYPWSKFAVEMEPVDDYRIKEGLQRLRRFITAFRARGKDKLARIKDKIESPRMTKGLGRTMLDALMRESVVYIDGKLYVLDASALGRVVGVTYMDCQKQRFGERASQFVDRALGSAS